MFTVKTVRQQLLVDTLRTNFPSASALDRNVIVDTAKEVGCAYPHFLLNAKNRVDRGTYGITDNIPAVSQDVKAVKATVKRMAKTSMQRSVAPASREEEVVEAVVPIRSNAFQYDAAGFDTNLVPQKDPLFVPFGNFSIVKQILNSEMFYPIFITGLSGNGKTYMVEQACAASKREVIRVNFTVETDEDDLIGGFRLVNGETKFFKGPVIKAMERGAILLCDEIDLANPAKIMCLQSILEGSGYFMKKTGEYIEPRKGFTVVATANTKGKGSNDGRFIGTNVMNEAFLERFPITCEQQYPSTVIEKKIMKKVFDSLGIIDTAFINTLVDWADIIRKTFMDGGVDEIISTRRLVHIAKAYAIFDDRMQAIDLCINRFDEDTMVSFRELYKKIDAEVGNTPVVEVDIVNLPF